MYKLSGFVFAVGLAIIERRSSGHGSTEPAQMPDGRHEVRVALAQWARA